MNKKLAILLPDGVGVRNFIYGKLINEMVAKGHEIIVFHFLHEGFADLIPLEIRQKIKLVKLPEIRESIPCQLIRQAKVFGQLYGRMKEDNSQVVFDMQFRHKPKGWKKKLFGFAVHTLAKIHKNLSALDRLEAKHQALVRKEKGFEAFAKILKSYAIDVIFCTHQRASKAVPVLEAAKSLGIKTATFIYSWDNLPKGRMATMPDYYFVWSKFMKQQMHTYYPSLSDERVIITGTPQFEPYFDKSKIWDKAEFLDKMNLTADRPIVCYSGDDETTSPFDEYYLKDIAEAFRKLPEPQRPQIIFRACPVDHSGRFDWVLKEYTEIVDSRPLWQGFDGNWTQILPTYQDLELLVNVTLHSDLVVNVASTMCFDFAIFDKPGVFINYNQEVTSEKEPYYNLKRGYQFPHFKVVHELQPVFWLNSKEEINDTFLNAIRDNNKHNVARKKWQEQMLDGQPNGSSKRIVEALSTIAIG